MALARHLPRFRRARAALAELAEHEGLSRSAIEQRQLEALNALWASASRRVPYCRDLAAERSLPGTFESLDQFREAVPPLTKEQVRDRPESLLAETDGDAALPGRWHLSGGSTGMPTRVFWTEAAHRQMLATRYRHDAMFGLDVFDRKVFLWGHAESFAPGLGGRLARLRRPILDRLRNRLRLSAYRLAPSDLDQHLDRMQRFGPRSIYGYSSAVDLLARRAVERGVRVPTLKLAVLTGEPAHADIVQTIERAFGVPAVVEYGSVETGVIASEYPDRTLRVREDVLMVETPHREDGFHDILVTVLINPAFPLLRYRVGDLTSQPLSRPETGFAILHDVTGRDNDLLVGRGGQVLHPMGVKHVLEDCPGVQRFRAHQSADGAIRVTVEQRGGETIDTERPRRQLAELLGGADVTVDVVDRIEGNRAGKHRWVVSEHTPPTPRPATEPACSAS